MIKNLSFLVGLFLSGCILVVEHDAHHHTSEVDLFLAHTQCVYGGYYDVSEWYFEIYAEAPHGPYEVADVGFYINNYDYQEMNYAGDGLWYTTFMSTYYDCDRSYHFDFIASDYEGNTGHYTSYW